MVFLLQLSKEEKGKVQPSHNTDAIEHTALYQDLVTIQIDFDM